MCGRFLSEDDFHWHNKKKNTKQNSCKKCKKNINALRNKDKTKENNIKNIEKIKQYRIDNKKQLSEYNKQYCKQYYIENKEKHQEYYKKWYIDNKKWYLKQNKQYRKDNPEMMYKYSVEKRLLKTNQTPDLTKEERKKIKQLYKIRDLLNHNDKDFHIDHIKPISKGGLHHPDNLQILPDWLNLEKHAKWPLTENEQIRYEGFRI